MTRDSKVSETSLYVLEILLELSEEITLMAEKKRTNEAKTGAILSVDSNTGRLTIEGCTIVNSNNQEEPYPIHVSNVVVTKIDESDKLRVQQLTSKRS